MSATGQQPLLVIGAGGHARVLADCLKRSGFTVSGFLDVSVELHGQRFGGVPVIGDDGRLPDYPPTAVSLVNGVGSVDLPERRQAVFERLSAAGYGFQSVLDASSLLAGEVAVGVGVQIMAGAIVQTGAQLADNVLINTGAIVEHHCVIGRHCHIATGARLGGDVTVGDGCHIGAGATVIQGRRIGSGALIAAGAVVTKDVMPGERVGGIPARVL